MTKQIITAETVRLAWKAGESVIVYAKGDVKGLTTGASMYC